MKPCFFFLLHFDNVDLASVLISIPAVCPSSTFTLGGGSLLIRAIHFVLFTSLLCIYIHTLNVYFGFVSLSFPFVSQRLSRVHGIGMAKENTDICIAWEMEK